MKRDTKQKHYKRKYEGVDFNQNNSNKHVKNSRYNQRDFLDYLEIIDLDANDWDIDTEVPFDFDDWLDGKCTLSEGA